MSKLIYFILGAIVGVVGVLLFQGVYSGYQEEIIDNPYHIPGLHMLDTEGECVTSEPIKVFQVITENSALATERSYGELNLYTGKVVFIINDNGQTYYDDQVIKPKKCFRQVGILRYEANNGSWKTVPAVKNELEKAK